MQEGLRQRKPQEAAGEVGIREPVLLAGRLERRAGHEPALLCELIAVRLRKRIRESAGEDPWACLARRTIRSAHASGSGWRLPLSPRAEERPRTYAYGGSERFSRRRGLSLLPMS